MTVGPSAQGEHTRRLVSARLRRSPTRVTAFLIACLGFACEGAVGTPASTGWIAPSQSGQATASRPDQGAEGAAPPISYSPERPSDPSAAVEAPVSGPSFEVPGGETPSVPQGPSEPAPAGSAALAQRPGDPELGRQLLLDNGTEDHPIMSCGIPEAVAELSGMTRDWDTAQKLAGRRDADLPYDLNYVVRPSGERVLATNCLLCHAGRLGGAVIIGLPDATRDFTQRDPLTGLVGRVIRRTFDLVLPAAAEVEFKRMLRVADAMSAFPRPDTRGLNPADSLFGVLAIHRDPDSLVWRDLPDPAAGPTPQRMIFTDVPPLWNTRRHAALFATGFGRGDHARLMMTGALLCLEDRHEAEQIDAYFPHVRAFIESLRAPSYEAVSGLSIDSARAERGGELYAAHCVRCHGGKADEGPEPLPFVDVSEVGTDPVYAQVTARNNELPEAQTIGFFFDFFNRSWYGKTGATARLERPASVGYVVPALDGIWATAPYFHNASVPTLDAVLDPRLRPSLFRRSFDPDEYDFERLGFPFREVAYKGLDTTVYDTHVLGHSNAGHDYAAELDDEQRRDLLEYLKTF